MHLLLQSYKAAAAQNTRSNINLGYKYKEEASKFLRACKMAYILETN